MGWKTGTFLAAASIAALAQGAGSQQASAQQSPVQTPAQAPQQAAAETEGVRKFEPPFFALYEPVTA